MVLVKMYSLGIKEEADKIFFKLSKKNKKQIETINKKIEKIRLNPLHEYKFLHKPLQNFNRVHIDTNFVLIFQIHHNKKTVEIHYFDHHDLIYKWRPT